MSATIIGNHSANVFSRTEQSRIRTFYRDVLGCELVRESDNKDDFVMGGDFHMAFLYEDDVALDAESFMKATYLELKVHDVKRMREKILGFGVQVLEIEDPHLYFQAPGGQVFRLVGTDEDLSKYEGTEHRELPSHFESARAPKPGGSNRESA